MDHLKCILHCGHEKTGSTSIQAYLRIQRSNLLKLGICYPHFGLEGNHHYSVAYAYADSVQGRPFFREASGYQSLEDLLGNTAKNPTPPKVIILSSESIFSLRPQEFERLTYDIQRFCKSLSIVVYTRDPVDYFPSLFQTQIKNGVKRLTHCDPPVIINYTKKLRHFLSLLRSSDSLYVRDSTRSSLINNDIVDDFLTFLSEHLGIGISKNTVDLPLVNKSLTLQAVIAADYMQTRLNDRALMMHSPDVRSYLESIQGDQFVLPLDIADKIRDLAATHVEYLSRHHAISYKMTTTKSYGSPDYNIGSYPGLRESVDRFLSMKILGQ